MELQRVKEAGFSGCYPHGHRARIGCRTGRALRVGRRGAAARGRERRRPTTGGGEGSRGRGAGRGVDGQDLSQEEGAAATVKTALDRWGRVDVLVNNAGGGLIRPFLEHTAET